MNKWSISKRAVFLGLAPAVFMFFSLTAYFIHDKLEVLNKQLDNKGELLVQQLAPATEYAVFIKNPALLEDTVSPILQQPDVAFINIFDENGELLLSRKNLSLANIIDSASIREFQTNIVLQNVPLESSDFSLNLDTINADDLNKIIGSITIGLTTLQLQQAQKDALLGGILIALLCLLFATLLALSISRTITNPVKSLSETVKLFKSGLLSARVAERSGGELGVLESNINALAISLERAKRKEQEHTMALEQARAQALAASHSKSQFLLSISHQLKQTMTGSLGHLKLLEASPLDLKQQSFVEQTIVSINQLLNLLDKIVDYSQLQSESFQLTQDYCDLERLVNQCRTYFLSERYSHNINLHISLEDKHTDLEIYSDQKALKKIIFYLIDHAQKQLKLNQIDVLVKWRPIEEQHKLLLTIEVSGAKARSAEEPSQQTEISLSALSFAENIDNPSLHLELVIAKQLMNLLGGTINPHQQNNEELLFSLEFIVPYRQSQSNTEKTTRIDEPQTNPINGRVLVIDPNPVDLQVAKEMLNLFGATVNTAVSGKIGLERIRQFSYQLVIIDTDISDETLASLIDNIKAYARSKNQPIPLLVTSAHSNIDAFRRLLPDPFDDILEKPYSLQMLKSRVIQMLNRAKQSQPTISQLL
jgi:signal transduction histidine kinase